MVFSYILIDKREKNTRVKDKTELTGRIIRC